MGEWLLVLHPCSSFAPSPLHNRVESRKRGLQFHLPLIVPVGQHCRLVESSAAVTSLQEIYERHCHEVGMSKDEPIMVYIEKLKQLIEQSKSISAGAKLEAYIEVASKIFPDTIVKDVRLAIMVECGR